ncbi:DUF4157 domain-containing protein [Leptolyngbya sp. FACHB-671]|nr:DUF4157 domain-containing protein [Leptolyngbya sp. FACHB-671]
MRSHVQRKTSTTPPPAHSSFFWQRPFTDQLHQASDSPQSEPTSTVALKPTTSALSRVNFDSDRPASEQHRPLPIQPKLTVGAPNDQYEQEADRVAEQVMSMPDTAIQQPIQREAVPDEEELQTKPIAASITPLVQREAIPEEEELQTKSLGNSSIQREEMPEEEELQMKAIAPSIQREEMPEEEEVQTKAITNTLQREELPEEEEIQTKSLSNSLQREEMPEEEEVQTKPALQRSPDGSLRADSSIESRLNSSKGGGSPLPEEVRSFMEPRFGADFSQVRVHTGSEAVQMSQAIGAQAFTHGNDIYFGAGKSPANSDLTAHELTHVVQQTNENPSSLRFKIQREISTPIPWDSEEHPQAQKDGSVNLQVAQVRVTIKPDKKSKNKKMKGAHTTFNLTWKAPTPKNQQGKVVSISSAPLVNMTIQTTYGPQADPYEQSAYGKGTTEQDIADGNTTLKYHEGSHGTDYMEYLRQNPLPSFTGQEDMTIKEYMDAVKQFNQNMRDYNTQIQEYSKQQTDCVGTPSGECK